MEPWGTPASNLGKIEIMGNIEFITKLSTLKSVFNIDNDYLEAATGGVLKNFVNLQESTCVEVSFG